MDCTCTFLCGEPNRHAGREDCKSKEPGDKFREIYGPFSRQAFGMLCYDMHDSVRKALGMVCHCYYSTGIYYQRFPTGCI